MTDMTQRATFETRRDHLDTLAGRLATFDREISVSRTGVPMLVVTNPQVPALTEHVLCCHDTDGTLGFFFPWGQRIAAADHPDTAAHTIMRVLGTG